MQKQTNLPLEEVKEKKLPFPYFGGKRLRRVNVALFLLSLFLVHLVVYVLGARFSWYLYTEERYSHTVGVGTAAQIEAIEHPVTVRFCMPDEDLKADVVYSLVYNTADQYANMYPNKIAIGKPLNVYLDHAEVTAYSEKSGSSLSKTSVIVESDAGVYVADMSGFFLFDDEMLITAYNGEEAFFSLFHWVQVPEDKRDKIYFTVDHGEQLSLFALQSSLMMAGYDPQPIRLSSEEIPEDASAVVISNPLYDFEASAPNSGVLSELDRLSAYLDAGGTALVTLDPSKESYKELVNLRALLSSYGVTAGEMPFSDRQNAVTQDGKVLLASNLRSGGRLLLREPAILSLSSANEKTAAHTVYAASFDTADAGGIAGAYPIAVLSEAENGGRLFTVSTGYLFYDDALHTDSYTNRTLLYSLLTDLGCKTAPVGCTILPIASEMLENLTAGESELFFILTAAVLPAAVLVGGAVIYLRRRTR